MLKPLFAFAAAVASALALTTTSAAAIPLPVTPHRAATATPHQQTSTPHNPRLKEILSEDEEQDEPEAPALSAQCQRFIDKPNPYRPTGPNVDMIHSDNIAAIGSQTGCYTAQNETTIATNLSNPATSSPARTTTAIYNARENRKTPPSFAYTSIDGGKTWTDVMLPGLTYSDRRGRRAARDGRFRRPGGRVRPAQHRLLRQHRVQPGRSGRRRHRAA